MACSRVILMPISPCWNVPDGAGVVIRQPFRWRRRAGWPLRSESRRCPVAATVSNRCLRPQYLGRDISVDIAPVYQPCGGVRITVVKADSANTIRQDDRVAQPGRKASNIATDDRIIRASRNPPPGVIADGDMTKTSGQIEQCRGADCDKITSTPGTEHIECGSRTDRDIIDASLI